MKGRLPRIVTLLLVLTILSIAGYFVIKRAQAPSGLATGQYEGLSIYVGENLSYPVINDLNYDGHKEIILTGRDPATNQDAVFALDYQGNKFFTPSPLGGKVTNPVVGRISESDKFPSIVVASWVEEANKIIVYWLNDMGNITNEMEFDDQSYLSVTDPVLKDVTLDGKADVIIGAVYKLKSNDDGLIHAKILVVDPQLGGANVYNSPYTFSNIVGEASDLISPLVIGKELDGYKVISQGQEHSAIGGSIFFTLNKTSVFGLSFVDVDKNSIIDANDKIDLLKGYPIAGLTPGLVGPPTVYKYGNVVFGDVNNEGYPCVRSIWRQPDGKLIVNIYKTKDKPDQVIRTGHISYSTVKDIMIAPFLISWQGKEMISGKLCQVDPSDGSLAKPSFGVNTIDFFPEEYDSSFLEVILFGYTKKTDFLEMPEGIDPNKQNMQTTNATESTYYAYGRLIKSTDYEWYIFDDIPKALAIVDLDGDFRNYEVVACTAEGNVKIKQLSTPISPSENKAMRIRWPMLRWSARPLTGSQNTADFNYSPISPVVNKIVEVKDCSYPFAGGKNVHIPVGSKVTVEFLAADRDVDDILTYNVTGDVASNIDYNETKGLLTVTYSSLDKISHSIFLSAQDAFSSSDFDKCIIVNGDTFIADGADNQSPSILEPAADKLANEGEELKISVSAKDPENDPLTYGIVDIPKGADFDSQKGIFKWKPSYDQAGIYYVTFTVSDDKCGSASKKIKITVKNTYLALTITVSPKAPLAGIQTPLNPMKIDPSGQVVKAKPPENIVKLSPAPSGTLLLMIGSSAKGYYYKEGTQVTLTAVPMKGYKFVSWAGGITSVKNPLPSITISKDISLTAKFKKVTKGA